MRFSMFGSAVLLIGLCAIARAQTPEICRNGQLQVSHPEIEGGSNHSAVEVRVTNLASVACFLGTQPVFEIRNRSGKMQPSRLNGDDYLFASSPKKSVTLQPGRSAYFLIGTIGVCTPDNDSHLIWKVSADQPSLEKPIAVTSCETNVTSWRTGPIRHDQSQDSAVQVAALKAEDDCDKATGRGHGQFLPPEDGYALKAEVHVADCSDDLGGCPEGKPVHVDVWVMNERMDPLTLVPGENFHFALFEDTFHHQVPVRTPFASESQTVPSKACKKISTWDLKEHFDLKPNWYHIVLTHGPTPTHDDGGANFWIEATASSTK